MKLYGGSSSGAKACSESGGNINIWWKGSAVQHTLDNQETLLCPIVTPINQDTYKSGHLSSGHLLIGTLSLGLKVCPHFRVQMHALIPPYVCPFRWWPSEVVHPDDIPDNILAKKPGDCMFVVRFCGSQDFCWTYHGRVLPYSDEMELEARGHHKKPKTTDNYKKGVFAGV